MTLLYNRVAFTHLCKFSASVSQALVTCVTSYDVGDVCAIANCGSQFEYFGCCMANVALTGFNEFKNYLLFNKDGHGEAY